MKKYVLSSLCVGMALSISGVFAQELTDEVEVTVDCAPLTYNLVLGSRDKNTRGDVTTLQTYLSQTGYLETDPTGYFGGATKRAVQAFQRANGISPTGNVGAFSRSKIKELTCKGGVAVSGTSFLPQDAATVRAATTVNTNTMTEKEKMALYEKQLALQMGQSVSQDQSSTASGNATYEGYIDGRMFIRTENISKSYAIENCEKNIASNPSRAIKCLWNGVVVKSSVGSGVSASSDGRLPQETLQPKEDTANTQPIKPAPFKVAPRALPPKATQALDTTRYSSQDVGDLVMYVLKSDYAGEPSTDGPYTLKFQSARDTCSIKRIQFGSVICDFAGGEIYNYKTGLNLLDAPTKPLANQPPAIIKKSGPGINAMSCANPKETGLPAGSVGCYGVWDYGSEFGNDMDMCPANAYGSGQTGCEVKTQACASGVAVASAYFKPVSSIGEADLKRIAARLGADPQAVQDQIPGLWEYTCK
jgi:peptidoglycan hydrolase-like protein with peptidoglycan-binding domain